MHGEFVRLMVMVGMSVFAATRACACLCARCLGSLRVLVRHHVLGDVLLRHVLGARLSVLVIVSSSAVKLVW